MTGQTDQVPVDQVPIDQVQAERLQAEKVQAERLQAEKVSADQERIRFADYIRTITVEPIEINYSELTRFRATGWRGRVPLGLRDYRRLLVPYVGDLAGEQTRAVVPLAVYLALFQMLILRQGVADPFSVMAGLVAVIVGLMLFMEGLRIGLMPFGEAIGHALPTRTPLPVVMAVSFLLGVTVTFAEPAIGALQTAGSLVSVDEAPYLYALLNQWTTALVLVVGIGVGLAAVVGMLRFLYGWSLKPLIVGTVAVTLALSWRLAGDPDLVPILALAWDCGAVTTGPVTVPLVLALGIGVAASSGQGESSLSGFGIVTLASLFPVIAVMLLGLLVQAVQPIDGILAHANEFAGSGPTLTPWYFRTPLVEIGAGLRSILPLVAFLWLVARYVARAGLEDVDVTRAGIGFTLAGMIIFNLGLTFGLAELGVQSGEMVPAAFLPLADPETGQMIDGTPYYGYGVGLAVAFLFALLLGFGATIAEPALNTLGITVESLTNGAFRKSTLVTTVGVGVAVGIALGVAKLIFDLPIYWMVMPGYLLALVLSLVSTEEYVNVAWDSAGVTTGPVTVPLVLALGLGLGGGLGAVEGFGILAMASIGPIVAVLAVGLAVNLRARRREQLAAAAGTVVVPETEPDAAEPA